MSSSDYIRYKRVMNGLTTLNTLPRVLTNTQYAEFKSISLEKNIQPVDKYEYWYLLPEEARVVGGILRLNPSNCPDFCNKNTDTGLRPNMTLRAPGFAVPLKLQNRDYNPMCKCNRTF